MNKFGIVIGVAAVATLAGCKDPNYKYATIPDAQDGVSTIAPKPISPEEIKCTCAPGTIHSSPCMCGAPDCKCVYNPPPPPPPPPPAEPEFTTYIVQPGDYVAKISKKYNIKIDAIRKLNNLKNDKIRVGQKLKLPGKVDVGEQKSVTTATATKKVTPYTGATKEYVVKAGDSLGKIALTTGCTVAQLKDLNGLSKDVVRVNQKLKVPAEAAKKAAEKKPAEKKVAPPVEPSVAPVADEALDVPPPADKVASEADKPLNPPTELDGDAVVPPALPAENATTTYIVQAGDDIAGVALRCNVSAAEIRELNNLGSDAELTPGQVLKVPAEDLP